MKSKYFKKYALIGIVLAALLLVGSPVWGGDFTTNYYRIEGAQPDLYLKDTDSNDADWFIFADYFVNQSFSIKNHDGLYESVPFIIENYCDNYLLYLDSAERIGIRTSAPAYTVDAIGDRIRLRKSTSGTARTIQMRVDGLNTDLQADNADLYIRADPNDVLLNPYGGYVGVGLTSPSKTLHVKGHSSAQYDANNTAIRVENNSITRGTRQMLQLVNNGNPALYFHNTYSGRRWTMNPIENDFRWNAVGIGSGYEMILENDGDLTISGNLTQNSDRNSKEAIVEVKPDEILARVAALPVSTWQYKADNEKCRHLGPMAQDFYAAFGLGRDEKGISPGDVSGVALAAIKGLYAQSKEKDEKIAQLEEKIAGLEKQLQAQSDLASRLSDLEPVVATILQQLKTQPNTVKASLNMAY